MICISICVLFVLFSARAEVDPFNASLISPTIGLSNFVFRIISGFAANKYRSQTTYMCGGGIVFGGIATLASAFYGEDVVWFQYTYAACYGVAPGGFNKFMSESSSTSAKPKLFHKILSFANIIFYSRLSYAVVCIFVFPLCADS